VDVIEGQWKATVAHRERGQVVPYVFHNGGRRMRDFIKGWHGACRRAGLAARIPHDFRRTAARNVLRAGIPQRIAMEIGGWKTDSVFRRYAITDERLLAENLKKLVQR
jgi:integrase